MDDMDKMDRATLAVALSIPSIFSPKKEHRLESLCSFFLITL